MDIECFSCHYRSILWWSEEVLWPICVLCNLTGWPEMAIGFRTGGLRCCRLPVATRIRVFTSLYTSPHRGVSPSQNTNKT